MPQVAESRPQNLEQLLDRLGQAGDGEKVSIGSIVGVIGCRSLGPLLLVAGLIAASPLSGIPGVPTTLGVLVALVAAQLIFRHGQVWLPRWILQRRISRRKFCRALELMRRPSRFIDRFLRPRLVVLTKRGGAYGVALLCIVIGLAMPPLELVPFSTSIAGVALAAFGLSLVSHDGVLGLAALAVTAATALLIAYVVLL